MFFEEIAVDCTEDDLFIDLPLLFFIPDVASSVFLLLFVKFLLKKFGYFNCLNDGLFYLFEDMFLIDELPRLSLLFVSLIEEGRLIVLEFFKLFLILLLLV